MIPGMRALVPLAFALIASTSVAAAEPSYSLIGDSDLRPPDPLGDSIPTRTFDPAAPGDPLARPDARDASMQPATRNNGSFAFKPAQAQRYSSALGADSSPSRLGARLGSRLGARIDYNGGTTPDYSDPRERVNADPRDRIEGPRNAYNSNR